MNNKLIFPFAINKHQNNAIVFDGVHDWGYTKDSTNYIDLSLGSCGCLPLGFQRKDFIESVQSKLSEFPFISGEYLTTNKYVIELAERLYSLSSGYRSIFATSGSDAIETAIKVAKNYQPEERNVILGMRNSYHGSTYMSSSIGDSSYLHKKYGRDPNCLTVEWNLKHIEYTLLKKLGQVLCIVVESCSWQAGLHSYPDEWWIALRKLCDDHKVLLIIDDIAFCGAKTDSFFGFNKSIKPDIICAGKALSGGYYPLSACLVSEKLYDVIKETRFSHGFSYSFNMSGILSALHYLNVIEQERILDNHLAIKQHGIDMFKHLPSVRNYGLTWCIDVNINNKTEDEIFNLFLENGLYLGIWNNPLVTKQILINFPNVINETYYKNLEERLQSTLEQLCG
jgi:adenosylmethionine-8-amino-7-oxononanoate aminotransferase